MKCPDCGFDHDLLAEEEGERKAHCVSFMLAITKVAQSIGLTPTESMASLKALVMMWQISETTPQNEIKDAEFRKKLLMFLEKELEVKPSEDLVVS